MMTRYGVALVSCVVGLGSGCSKSETPLPTGRAETVEAPATPTASAMPSASPAPAPSATAASADAPAPAAWTKAPKFAVKAELGLGCETRRLPGWLRVLCRSKNGTGGSPTEIVIGDGSTPGASGELVGEELVFVTPWRAGTRVSADFVWTNTRYTLAAEWPAGSAEPASPGAFKWAGEIAVHRACAKLQADHQRIVDDAKKASDPVPAAQAMLLPRGLGECREAGLGSWAVTLGALSAAKCGTDACVSASFEIVRVQPDGKRLSAKLGELAFVPGNLKLVPPVVYDWNADGRDDLLVVLEHEPADSEKAQALAAAPSPILSSFWTWTDTEVVAYPKAPALAVATTVQIGGDARPDPAGRGPFLAYLPSRCGISGKCPRTLAGPLFAARSNADGSFALDDAASRSHLEKACGKPPASLVGADLEKTALNVACARARGTASEDLKRDLAAQKAGLCSEEPCLAYETLVRWADAKPPATFP